MKKYQVLRFPNVFLPIQEVDNKTMMKYWRYIQQKVKDRQLLIYINKNHDWDKDFTENDIEEMTRYLSVQAYKKYGCGVKLLDADKTSVAWVLEKRLPEPVQVPRVQPIQLGA